MERIDVDWCATCCTRHGLDVVCPGDARVTAEEVVGARLRYTTRRGRETYGVLLAPTLHGWRARIVTLPKALWTLPGVPKTMKFLGGTREKAEAEAFAFIKEHCRRRGHKPADEKMPGSPAAGSGDEPAVENRLARRKPLSIPALWGSREPEDDARTLDLSVGGLFLATALPPHVGARIVLLLDPGERRVRLAGTVVWSRRLPDGDLPAGMGVQLHHPPREYFDLVRRIRSGSR